MDIAVIHFTNCFGNTTLASAKIARFIHEQLMARHTHQVALISQKEWAIAYREEVYDVVFVVNSPFGFCDFREEIVDIVSKAKNRIWIQNDYTLPIPTQMKHLSFKTWSNILSKDREYINWNLLTYVPRGKGNVGTGFIYWGAYRQDRVADFDKYFGEEYDPQFNISSTSTDFGKYPVKLWGPFHDASQLAKFSTTLYVEDKKNHGFYNSPANRLYEALSVDLAVYVDEACRHTFRDAGFKDFDFCIVNGAADLKRLLPRADEIRKKQSVWKRDYRQTLLMAFSSMLKKEGIVS